MKDSENVNKAACSIISNERGHLKAAIPENVLKLENDVYVKFCCSKANNEPLDYM